MVVAMLWGNTSINIGDRNIEHAKEFLADHGIPIVDHHLGGTHGRKITFNTTTSELDHKLNEKSNEDNTGFGKVSVAKNIKVLIVDDSATIRHLFEKLFKKHGLNVVGAAANAFEAREMIVSKKPDVVTLDIEMPKMSGVAFLEKLMAHMPLPVVMVSSLDNQGAAAMKALELGAIDFIQKPSQHKVSDLNLLGKMVVEKVTAAASMNVMKRKPSVVTQNYTSSKQSFSEIKLITVGGNTGTQDDLATLVSTLAEDTPPVIVANSLVSNILESYMEKLKPTSNVDLKIAKDGEFLLPGTVYFAPPGMHTEVKGTGNQIQINLVKGPPINNQLPSSNALFNSAARLCKSGCLGILLGGFGSDGVDGLTNIKNAGGNTIVQDPNEAKYPYIPQSALALGIVDLVGPVTRMAKAVMKTRSERAA